MKQSIILLVITGLIQVNAIAATEDRWARSYTYESKEEYQKAAALIRPVLGSAKQSEFASLRYAWLSYRNKKYDTSIRYYKRALQINRDSIDARLGLLLPLMAKKRWKDVKKQSKAVLKIDPYNYLAHVRLMMSEEAEMDWNKLSKHAGQLTKRYPANLEPWLYLARAEAWKAKRGLAIEAYEKVLMISPRNLEAKRYISGSD